MAINLTAMPGDGIGPELARSALDVMRAACDAKGVTLAITEEPGGTGLYRETGESRSSGTCRPRASCSRA